MPFWQVRGCVRVLLNDPASELSRHIAGDQASLAPVDVLYQLRDLLAGANWQRAGKGPRPKPLAKLVAEHASERRRQTVAEQDHSALIDYLAQFDPAYQTDSDEEDQPE